MRIVIETIPHAQQRYDTVGDWQMRTAPRRISLPVASMTGVLQEVDAPGEAEPFITITVSEIGNWRFEALVALHELIEALLCHDRGVTSEEVDRFDMGPGKDLDEPGADPRAPYHVQHELAEMMERTMCSLLRIDWRDYCEGVDKCGS